MKTRNLVIMLVASSLTLGSCQKIKDALVTKQDVKFQFNLPVTVTEPVLKSTQNAFSETIVFDPLKEPLILENKDRIRNIELNSLILTVKNLSASPVTLTNSYLVFTAELFSLGITVTRTIPMNGTYNSDDSKTVEDIDLYELKELIAELDPITITFSGDCDKSGVTFKLDALINSEVTIQLIK